MHWYQLGSWKVCSSLSLPWLSTSVDGIGDPDILIETGTFPVPDSVPLVHTVLVDVHPECAIVRIPSLVSFKVENSGKRIVVDIQRGVDPAEIQPFLLGIGLALSCYQRGLIPLNGCAVSKENIAVAILGRSGCGKSTLAAAMVNRGYKLVSDDILILDPDTGYVTPTYPILGLWQDSIRMLGILSGHLKRMRPGLEKWSLPVQGVFHDQHCHLKSVILLSSQLATSPKISRLNSVPALAKVHSRLYSPRLARMPGMQQRSFATCNRLIEQASVFEVNRTAERNDLNTLIDLIEAAVIG